MKKAKFDYNSIKLAPHDDSVNQEIMVNNEDIEDIYVPDSELFKTSDGRVVIDPIHSEKLFLLKQIKPEEVKRTDTGYERSEIGMAKLFGELYLCEARYCSEYKSWFTYHGGVWQEDYGAILVSEKLKDFVRLMILYCGEITDDTIRGSYLSFVQKMGDRRFRDRILNDAKGVLLIKAEVFDSNPYIINCTNGTYNLQAREFKKHSYKDYCTKQTKFSFTLQKDINCKRWEQFIEEVTEGNWEKQDFLQRALGYSLLGKSTEECMFILHGKTTRNGKSTLLNTIEHMMGGYSTVAPVGLICKSEYSKSTDGATPILAGLKGKRFVTMSESNEYGRLDEEKIKQLTGGEEVSARALYQAPIKFAPQFALWLSCNDLPIVKDMSLFASERIKLIEFNKHFNANEQNKNLKHEFMKDENMRGIFRWLIKGYYMYMRRGLVLDEELQEVVRAYQKSSDIIEQFLDDRCIKQEKGKIRGSTLYNYFKSWCSQNQYKPISAKKFHSEMNRFTHLFDKYIAYAGYLTYTGIDFKKESEDIM